MTKQLKQQLLTALKVLRPDIGKSYLYERCVNKYLDALIPAIGAALARSDTSTMEFFISHAELRDQVGRIGNPQEYIYYLMNNHPTTSLILEMSKGFSQNGNGRLSSAIINPRYKGLVIEILTTTQPKQTATANGNYTVPVDVDSLRSYIAATQATRDSKKGNDAYREKLFRNINKAKQILAHVLPPSDSVSTHYLNERWEQADSGRIYGQGLSLQCMPKEVRNAALGVCHKYDFKACAFAIMASLAHEIAPTLRLGAVLDYIQRRKIIRKQIAKQVGIDESLVKTIFTAVGFGAELHNSPYKSIRAALAKAARQRQVGQDRLSKHDYQRLGQAEYKKLIENIDFRCIYNEFDAINNAILDYFEDVEIEINERPYSAIDPKTRKKRNKRQKLAWIYQAFEFKAMLKFVELCKQEPLLTTHDCVYLKTKLTASQIDDIRYKLQQNFPYLDFEYELIEPIGSNDYFEKRKREVRVFEQEHREHIRREEMAALDWMSKRLSGN